MPEKRSCIRELFPVSIYVMFSCTTTLFTLILTCSSTYDTIDDILTQIHKFEFNKFERSSGIAAILLEFSWHITQRPIEFRVGGFYCLTQPLLATVRKEQVCLDYMYFVQILDHHWYCDIYFVIGSILHANDNLRVEVLHNLYLKITCCNTV